MMNMLKKSSEGENYSAWMIQQVGLPVAKALTAFGAGRYSESVEHLWNVRYTANRFGGSHAQRDVISQTLIESAIRAEQYDRARALLSERAARKPTTPLTWQNTARVMTALQRRDEAESANRRARELLN